MGSYRRWEADVFCRSHCSDTAGEAKGTCPASSTPPDTESSSQKQILVSPAEAEVVLEYSWRNELLTQVQKLSPAAFERLCQRLQRESGFVEVRVTGKTGDGGIDGVGIVQLGGLLDLQPIPVQALPWYSWRVSHSRHFRGAMVGQGRSWVSTDDRII